MHVYNMHNVYNWLYNVYTNVYILLFGSDGTGSAREGECCGQAAVRKAGPLDRKEQSFSPSHYGHTGLVQYGKKVWFAA